MVTFVFGIQPLLIGKTLETSKVSKETKVFKAQQEPQVLHLT
jgi:hypothetical protein